MIQYIFECHLKSRIYYRSLRFDFCENLRPCAKITAFDSAYAKSSIQDETVRWLSVYVNPFTVRGELRFRFPEYLKRLISSTVVCLKLTHFRYPYFLKNVSLLRILSVSSIFSVQKFLLQFWLSRTLICCFTVLLQDFND